VVERLGKHRDRQKKAKSRASIGTGKKKQKAWGQEKAWGQKSMGTGKKRVSRHNNCSIGALFSMKAQRGDGRGVP
jgi:hypothetical protein